MEGKEDTQIIQEAPAAIEEKDERGKKTIKFRVERVLLLGVAK